MVTIDQMTPGGDFENIFSFTHEGVCDLFEATCDDFDLRMVNPVADADQRGGWRSPFGAPALDNRLALMGVIRDHVARFLELYFDSDDAIAGDRPFSQWLDDLSSRIPHGVLELAGPTVTLDGAVTLLSTPHLPHYRRTRDRRFWSVELPAVARRPTGAGLPATASGYPWTFISGWSTPTSTSMSIAPPS